MPSLIERLWPRLWGVSRKAVTAEDIRRATTLGSGSATGITVTPEAAMMVPTVLACARVIAEGVAQAQMRFYRQEDAGRSRVPLSGHPVAMLLGRRPNFWQTSFEFRETMVLHAALTGNAFALKSRAMDGRLIELLPFPFGAVSMTRETDMTVSYRVTFPGSGKQAKLTAADVWHFRGPSWNTWSGMEPTRFAREAIALAAATERRHALLHAARPDPGGIYTVDGSLGKEQFEFLRKWIVDTTTGANAGTPLILDRGAKWTSQGMTGVDSQHLETRKYQVEEICRAFRVNPLMVGHSDKTATYASAEQMFIAHVVHTLTPWCTRFEQAAETELFEEGDPVDVWFDLRSLMRGTAVDRATYLSKALGSGGSPAWITPNEAREIDGLDRLDDGEADLLPKPQIKPAAEQTEQGLSNAN